MAKLTSLFAQQDMTVGTPWKKIAAFAAPLLVGNIAQQLYNTADSIIVGKYVGDNALAAVGGSGPLINLMIVLMVGIATGAGIMVAQYYGARRAEDLAQSVGTALTLTLCASILLMIVGTILVGPMLRLMDTPAETFEMCRSYLRVMFLGVAGMAYYNILAGILRGLGDSLSALKYLVIATVLNVFLDLLFVAKFDLAVMGVAIATVMAQCFSAVLAFRKLLRMRDIMHLQARHFKLKKAYALQLVRLGMPSGLAQAVMSASALIVQSLTNSFGAAIVACNTIVMRIDGFVMMPNFTFGNSMTTYTGQNIGARRMDRVEQGIRSGLKMAIGTAAVLVAAILLFGRQIMHLFTNTQSIIDTSMRMMTIVAAGYVAFAVTQTLSGVMRGAGDTTAPMWVSFITTLGIRLPLAYLFAYLTRSPEYPTGRPESLYLSLLCSWCMGALMTIIVFRRGKWRKKSKMADEEKE